MSAAGVQEQIWCIKSSAAACRSKFGASNHLLQERRSKFGASNHLLQECRSKFGASNHLPQECRSKFGASNHLPQRAGANLVHQIICRSVQEQIWCIKSSAAGVQEQIWCIKSSAAVCRSKFYVSEMPPQVRVWPAGTN